MTLSQISETTLKKDFEDLERQALKENFKINDRHEERSHCLLNGSKLENL